MRRLTICLAMLFWGVCGGVYAVAGGGFEGGKPAYPLFLAGNGYYAVIAPDGSEMQRWKGGNSNDGWRLPNGHLLAATGEAYECDAQGKRVWQYQAKEKTGGGVFSCQRLANGHTLISENSTGTVFEVDAQGQKSREIRVPLNQKNRHQTLRMVRRLADGRTLICRSGANTVEIYDAQGVCVWQQKVPNLAFAAVCDAQGNVYVSCLDRIQKWSPGHALLWEFTAAESGLPIKNMTGIHLLPNGHLVVGCYAYGKGVGAFEVTPGKQVLWRYRSGRGHDSHMAVQLLDPSISEPLR